MVDSDAEKEKEIDMINKTIKWRCERINEGVDLYNRMANEIDATMQIDKLEPKELLRNIEKFYNIKGITQEAYKEAKDFFFGEFGQHVYGKISRFWSSISDNHEII
ncbi:MAG: hypothetical protein M1385_01905, partial [Candidatus Marsarchaeota archaeon]|nr:hypothetical protein [Candidatus Marsarchaeota archaeon]